MKRCAICKEIKPVTEFHRMARQKGGYRSQCKACRKELHRAYYEGNKENVLIRTASYRIAHPEVSQKSCQKWRKSKKGKLFYEKYDPPVEEKQARKAVGHAIEKGDFPKVGTFLCSICKQKTAIHYHHFKGYEKKHWLDVIPVCGSCHKAIEGR